MIDLESSVREMRARSVTSRYADTPVRTADILLFPESIVLKCFQSGWMIIPNSVPEYMLLW